MTRILLATTISDATLRGDAILAIPGGGLRGAIKDFVLARIAGEDRGSPETRALGQARAIPAEVAVTVLPDERPYAL